MISYTYTLLFIMLCYQFTSIFSFCFSRFSFILNSMKIVHFICKRMVFIHINSKFSIPLCATVWNGIIKMKFSYRFVWWRLKQMKIYSFPLFFYTILYVSFATIQFHCISIILCFFFIWLLLVIFRFTILLLW